MSELSFLLFLLTNLLLALMATRWISDRLCQPSVLGELLLGVAVGNLGVWLGVPFFRVVMNLNASETLSLTDPVAIYAASVFGALAEIGAVLLLFSVGLETSVSKMNQVGKQAAAVAIVGVIAPLGIAYLACIVLHIKMPVIGHLFLAATLSATSIGITASVLKEMGILNRCESEIILGAAVIDDVLGLILLAIVSRIATQGEIDLWLIGQTIGTSLLLGCIVIWFGEGFASLGDRFFNKLDQYNGRQFFALAIAFGFSWVAESFGLAAIVGAFAAGLVMNDRSAIANNNESKSTVKQQRDSLTKTVAPLENFLAPLFFLYIGMQVDMGDFLDAWTLLLAFVFSICAIVGKLLCGLAADTQLNRLAVGIGMIPRGEVGLVFLSVGRGLGVIGDSLFAALVIVVFVTTLITPPALKWTLLQELPQNYLKENM